MAAKKKAKPVAKAKAAAKPNPKKTRGGVVAKQPAKQQEKSAKSSGSKAKAAAKSTAVPAKAVAAAKSGKAAKSTAAPKATIPVEPIDHDAPLKPMGKGLKPMGRGPELPPELEASDGKRSKGCQEPGCGQPQMADRFCRLHYLKYWRAIINNRKHQARANLRGYIENLSEQFPEDYMDRLKEESSDGKLRDRLRELGFREEYESSAENPFQSDNFDEFLHGIKVDD